ncbi:MAG: cupin 2 protein [Ramlibacter sp.]|jgi:hypothetical protein|nr:cupin 2 protein [Ramlibacter sp.]MDB5912879.1 cupin 2 protein [Ramlibacter sp.]
MYVTRTRVPAGFHQAPGPQQFDRVGTVLSGTLYVTFGQRFDEQNVVAIEQGRIWTIPAHVSCFLWAKEGDVIVQLVGN